MIHAIRHRLYHLLEEPSPDDRLGIAVKYVILALILANVLAVILETVESVYGACKPVFYGLQQLSMYFFTIEYILRLWASGADARYRGIMGRARFALRPLALLDLIVLVPFYIPVHTLGDLRVLRALRVLRLLVLVRFGRFSEALRIMGQVFVRRRQQLYAMALVVLLLVLIASSLMYAVENVVQPKVFSSIPESMWWAVVTLTTVGYGDAYPITPMGKALACIIAFLGVGLFALPAGILASGFAEVMQGKHRTATTCPHCGKTIARATEGPTDVKER